MLYFWTKSTCIFHVIKSNRVIFFKSPPNSNQSSSSFILLIFTNIFILAIDMLMFLNFKSFLFLIVPGPLRRDKIHAQLKVRAKRAQFYMARSSTPTTNSCDRLRDALSMNRRAYTRSSPRLRMGGLYHVT